MAVGCTIPNPAFDETGTAGDTEGGSTSASTSDSGQSSQTGPDPSDHGSAESDGDTLPSTTGPMTSDTGVDPTEGSTGDVLTECPIPEIPAMTFEVKEHCDSLLTPQRGILRQVGANAWTFNVCPDSECPNDPNLCNAAWTLDFGPAGVQPPEHLHGLCVQLAFEVSGDGVNDPCRPEWITIGANEGGRPLYMAGWSLPDANTNAPFQEIFADPKCHCAGYDVECCAEAPDPGPQVFHVTPAGGGEAFAVYMGQSHEFDVDWQQSIVRYEFGNHRSLRASCEAESIHEWFVRDVFDP